MKKSKWTKVASERSEHSHLRLYKQVCHHLDSSYTLNLFKVPTHRPLTKKLPHCKRDWLDIACLSCSAATSSPQRKQFEATRLLERGVF